MFSSPHRGITLFELMLTLLLSAVLSYGVIHIAVALHLEVNRQQQQVQQLESMRLISYTLSQQNQQRNAKHCLKSGHFHLLAASQHRFTVYQCIHYHQQWQWLPVSYFIANDQHGVSGLYQQPQHGMRQRLASHIVALTVVKKPIQAIMVWLLSRSSQAIFAGRHCYYFVSQRYCQDDGYRYLSWPLYVS